MSRPLWFRVWSEAKNDAKLDALSADEFRCWFKLLCASSESEDRGTVEVDDTELLALELRVDSDTLTSALERMKRLKLVVIEDGLLSFPSFESRQYVKPSDRPEKTRERKARQRDKTPSEDVSRPCHASVTPLQSRAEQSREISEQSREGQTRASIALPSCLSTTFDGTKWTGPDGSKHDTAAKVLWAEIETAKNGIISTTDHAKFAGMIADICPPTCQGSEDEVANCLDVLCKAATKTKGKPTPLFRRIAEEDR